MATAKATKDATTTDATGPVFTDAPIPKGSGGRPAAPNPFMDVVAGLVPDSGAKVATLTREANDKAQASRVKRLLQDAGHAVDKSVRSVIVADGDTVTVTFWTVPRIIRGKA